MACYDFITLRRTVEMFMVYCKKIVCKIIEVRISRTFYMYTYLNLFKLYIRAYIHNYSSNTTMRLNLDKNMHAFSLNITQLL